MGMEAFFWIGGGIISQKRRNSEHSRDGLHSHNHFTLMVEQLKLLCHDGGGLGNHTTFSFFVKALEDPSNLEIQMAFIMLMTNMAHAAGPRDRR